eukprot:1893996-Prymnesium_polylepis.2
MCKAIAIAHRRISARAHSRGQNYPRPRVEYARSRRRVEYAGRSTKQSQHRPHGAVTAESAHSRHPDPDPVPEPADLSSCLSSVSRGPPSHQLEP